MYSLRFTAPIYQWRHLSDALDSVADRRVRQIRRYDVGAWVFRRTVWKNSSYVYVCLCVGKMDRREERGSDSENSVMG